MRIFKHLKRGSYHELLEDNATLQCPGDWAEVDQFGGSCRGLDNERMVVYCSLSNSSVWVRPYSMFFDGRFEEVAVVASLEPVELSEEEEELRYIEQCEAIDRAKMAGDYDIF